MHRREIFLSAYGGDHLLIAPGLIVSMYGVTVEKRRTAASVLTACLTQGDNLRYTAVIPRQHWA